MSAKSFHEEKYDAATELYATAFDSDPNLTSEPMVDLLNSDRPYPDISPMPTTQRCPIARCKLGSDGVPSTAILLHDAASKSRLNLGALHDLEQDDVLARQTARYSHIRDWWGAVDFALTFVFGVLVVEFWPTLKQLGLLFSP